jgi:hypothetical protein
MLDHSLTGRSLAQARVADVVHGGGAIILELPLPDDKLARDSLARTDARHPLVALKVAIALSAPSRDTARLASAFSAGLLKIG